MCSQRRQRCAGIRTRSCPVASLHLPLAAGGAEKGDKPWELAPRMQLVHQRWPLTRRSRPASSVRSSLTPRLLGSFLSLSGKGAPASSPSLSSSIVCWYNDMFLCC